MNEALLGVPARHVINSKGELTGRCAFGSPERMRGLLDAEGIVFTAEERVDMKRYGWDPTRDLNEAVNDPVNASERLLYLMRTDQASPLRNTENTK